MEIKKIISFMIIGLSMGLLGSCSSVKISVDVLSVPEKPAKWPVYTLVMGSNLSAQNTRILISESGLDYDSNLIKNEYSKLNEAFVGSMYQASQNAQFIEAFPLKASLIDSILPDHPSNDSITTFEKVCRAHHADAVLILDSLTLYVQGELDSDYFQNGNGGYQE